MGSHVMEEEVEAFLGWKRKRLVELANAELERRNTLAGGWRCRTRLKEHHLCQRASNVDGDGDRAGVLCDEPRERADRPAPRKRFEFSIDECGRTREQEEVETRPETHTPGRPPHLSTPAVELRCVELAAHALAEFRPGLETKTTRKSQNCGAGDQTRHTRHSTSSSAGGGRGSWSPRN
jgi:hypothetical protein